MNERGIMRSGPSGENNKVEILLNALRDMDLLAQAVQGTESPR